MKESYSIMQNISKPKSKSIAWFAVFILVGAISVLIILLYKELFPQGYLKSIELEQNQAKWESQHITHYHMSVDGDGYALSLAVTVEVKDGIIVSVVDTQNNEVLLLNDEIKTLHSYQSLFTVPGLFAYVSKTYLEKPAMIRVIYDSTLGYPTTIFVDPYTEPCCQDFAFEISDFEILP